MKEKGKMPVFESFKVPIAVIGLVMGMGMFTYCSESDKPSSSEKADLVVYGKIFTAEDNELVEAFAVKDGKYVY
ncbi:MAG: hypothetical protein IKI85_05380, partial [Bacteroidales bacterium]|nr:hypothetical protein [Bacteroidales bacterium]